MREGRKDYVCSTYALSEALSSEYDLQKKLALPPSLYKNLEGKFGLASDDSQWSSIRTPDEAGFRGLLSETLVVWCTEFGRMPTFQKGAQGRDHNPDGFTCWLAGAGVKPGYSHGSTDEFGYEAIEDVVTVHDFHATILHLLGLDHLRLTYYHNGLERRLTDVAGEVVHDLLA